jgi:N-methylhydantoinase B/oxoprolinase/acetone carboxylase alpha subunit
VYLEVNEGNWGGRLGKDGLDSIACLIENTRNNPVEELDMRFPLRNERYELRDEPIAPGKWRGGIGIVRENRFLVPGYLSSEAERHFDPPKGIFKGGDGCRASMIKNPGVEGEEALYSKVTGYPMQANELIQIKTANSGAYGNPFERDPQLVLDDVLDDFITVKMAEKDYGVVINPQTMTIDEDATQQRRVVAQ